MFYVRNYFYSNDTEFAESHLSINILIILLVRGTCNKFTVDLIFGQVYAVHRLRRTYFLLAMKKLVLWVGVAWDYTGSLVYLASSAIVSWNRLRQLMPGHRI